MKTTGLKVLMLLPLIGALGYGFDKQIAKQKEATGIDLPVQEWKLPAAMQEDGYIDESKMPKGSRYTEMVILGNKILNESTKYIGPQAKDPNS